ncbi:MAG: M14 family zinc carboxypeptidase [Aquaticitalea sp.]
MTLETLQDLFKTYKETNLFGRYICREHISTLITKHSNNFKIESIGTSVLGEVIDVIIVGNGPKKILMWSQMHGNESTTTKAIFDLLNVFASNSKKNDIKSILQNCTIAIIPMLNPDGAKAYTRYNANEIDLNRDAQDHSQPESVVLRSFFDAFKPNFCFNLHGQRTIFSAGYANYPATVSFLSPAQDKSCTITKNRQKAMEIIVKMNDNLQKQIPNQIGIYDDAFNLNCVGDTFQSLNVPTILFEAGHYKSDYNREEVRGFIFQSLLVAIHHIASEELTGDDYEAYLKIPQNQKMFYDIIIRNALVHTERCDIAILYEERLIDKRIQFIPIVDKIGDMSNFFGHKEIDANGSKVSTFDNEIIYEGYENVFVLLNNEKFSLIT